MRVVVTRPESSGNKTATLLRQRGHEPAVLPLTYPVYNGEALKKALVQPAALIGVTSAEALRALQVCDLDLTALFQRPLFAVGSATAAAAKKMGFQNILIGEGDGRALARLVVQTSKQTGFGGRLLYLAGKPREGSFEQTLASANIELEIVEIYEMKPVPWEMDAVDAILHGGVDTVLLYSRETARIFFDLASKLKLEDSFKSSAFICMSEKVLLAVPDQFREKAIASTVPSEAAMFELLDHMTGT